MFYPDASTDSHNSLNPRQSLTIKAYKWLMIERYFGTSNSQKSRYFQRKYKSYFYVNSKKKVHFSGRWSILQAQKSTKTLKKN